MKAVKRLGLAQRILGTAGACAVVVGLLGVSNDAAAQATGIRSTKHNLSSTSAATNNRVTGTEAAGTGTAQVCVFCHTPHAAALGNSEAPPLWNKNIPSGPASQYTTYEQVGSATLDGLVTSVGSISVACLSCHDGVQAMDNMVNAPGSGLGDGAGNLGLGYTWTSPGGSVDADGKLVSGAAALGTDLRNDHPIGIQYCGGPGTLGPSGQCKDPDFVGHTNRTITTQNGTSVTQFWVDVSNDLVAGTPNTREKTDMPLYARVFTDSATPYPSVECGSCHDPHVDGTGSSGPTFLRVSNAGSNVCLACHIK